MRVFVRFLIPLRQLRRNTPSAKTKARVPHPSRSWRRVGYHGSAPEALPRKFCLSHPSPRARRMGHPSFGGDGKEKSTDL
jgi:hypothetical protein